jgi:hypothetical protein
MKFVLLVEGYAERKVIPSFLKRWLDVRLSQPVGIKIVKFEGWAELVDDLREKARRYLDGPDSKDVIAVVSLLDLYGPTFYPAFAHTAVDRERWGRKHLQDKVAHSKFRHFFAVHETEAWLLSQPGIFPSQIRSLLPPKVVTPEQVNFNEPPAYLLDRLYKAATKKTYKKIVHGEQLFRKLDPEEAYKRCPRLKELLDEMLALAKACPAE